MAAVLACGPEAVLSHGSAASLWGFRPVRWGLIDVSLPNHLRRSRQGIVVHRRAFLGADQVARVNDIPVTSPVCTLIDIAGGLDRDQLETALNEADKRGLTDPERLREALDELTPRPGTRALKETLAKRTFALTDSAIERRVLKLAHEIGLSKPETGAWVNGFKVDLYWPELGLIIETDGLRYHRTPAQQARDRVRDQAHLAAGLPPLRFTGAQVYYELERVRAVLTEVAQRLRSRSGD
jgi:very-short-patch-repair endonuclease